ncbi:MAG TPA: hypothetical protein VEC96_12525, partial [Anaerolineae bacterium]|nr:hypothetical protein [Anaerolineae bacterium]
METAVGSLRGGFYKKLTQALVPLLIFAAIVINALAPIFALRWAAQPFLGALFVPRLAVSDIYNPSLSSQQLGFQAGDVLKQIDDAPVSSGRDVYLHLLQKQIDKRVALQLDRASTVSDSTVALPLTLTTSFPLQNLLLFFWLPYSIGLVYLAMGLVVYRLRGLDRVSKVFITFCAFVSIFMGALFDQFTFHFFTPIWLLILPLLGAGLLHLSFVFPVETRLARRKPWLPLIPYALALILAGMNLFNFFFATNPRIFLGIWVWNFSFIGLSILLFLVLLLNAHTTTFSTMVRRQIIIIFWGSLISFGPMAIWTLANSAGFNLQSPWFNLTTVLICFIVFPIVTAYAALRYRLLDLDIIFSRAIVYTLLTLLVTVVYFLVVSFLAVLLQDAELFKNPLIFTLFILLLFISLGPIKERLQDFVNQFFLREPSDFRQYQQQYSQALVSAPLETDQILNLLLKQVDEALGPAHALVFLKDISHSIFVIRNQQGYSDIHMVEVSFGPGD